MEPVEEWVGWWYSISRIDRGSNAPADVSARSQWSADLKTTVGHTLKGIVTDFEKHLFSSVSISIRRSIPLI